MSRMNSRENKRSRSLARAEQKADARGRIPFAVIARWSDAQEYAGSHHQHGFTVESAPGLGPLILALLAQPRPATIQCDLALPSIP